MKSYQDYWKTRLGFMLAAMGSAVGLGNIWRFPYITGELGGATFLLVYLGFVFLIGIPLLLAEFSIGKAGQKDAVGSFQNLAPGTKWHWTGFMGVIGGILILSFYSVVAGWSLFYLYRYVTGAFWTEPDGGFGQVFGEWTSSTIYPLFWQALFLGITLFIVIRGIKGGIEKANVFLMPALALLMIFMAGFVLTLDGAFEGLKFLFQPDWSLLGDPKLYLTALGQAFFSLSLGVGGMLTYGSYLKAKDKLPTATVGIGLMDTVFAIISGIIIFPAVFSFGLSIGEGPPLVFITLPSIFASMPLGNMIGIVFFVLLSMAALSSAISLLELPVAFFSRTIGMTRKAATYLCTAIIFVLGVASSFGYGIWSGVTPIGDRDILGSIDYITANFMLPLGALLMALFVGLYLNKEQALANSEIQSKSLANVWYFIVKFVVPIILVVIVIAQVFDITA
ncbi:putative sodium-dependent transporter YocR [Tenuibacillus multivorans]|uniref:Neurotransmitter:Na+ symporter, NSS family n=1 Tax=Tenuibacillus multivorans TaxID=237069 RepID=A0A1G9WX19_9BACI|nr:sodium-dependent transporter [Tenuibacillus multivorans]GEL77317.1 putative sodium-dependent transporter YocR [Tenuibacillus multivorans]SDM89042.1 neurotransmitter:Na+ symporter, NSS family [Tenuibacillus multivorans]